MGFFFFFYLSCLSRREVVPQKESPHRFPRVAKGRGGPTCENSAQQNQRRIQTDRVYDAVRSTIAGHTPNERGGKKLSEAHVHNDRQSLEIQNGDGVHRKRGEEGQDSLAKTPSRCTEKTRRIQQRGPSWAERSPALKKGIGKPDATQGGNYRAGQIAPKAAAKARLAASRTPRGSGLASKESPRSGGVSFLKSHHWSGGECMARRLSGINCASAKTHPSRGEGKHP